MGVQVGERFVRVEKKTNKERILVMSTKLKEVLDFVIEVLKPEPSHLYPILPKREFELPASIGRNRL